jgi:hypothetical protein
LSLSRIYFFPSQRKNNFIRISYTFKFLVENNPAATFIGTRGSYFLPLIEARVARTLGTGNLSFLKVENHV